MNKSTRFNMVYALVAVLGVILLHDLWTNYRKVTPLPYSEFKTLVGEGKVKEIVITANEIRGELKEPDAKGRKYFHTTRVDTNLAEDLHKHDVKFSGKVESQFFATLLSWIVPVLLFVGIWLFIIRRAAGQMGAGGGRGADVYWQEQSQGLRGDGYQDDLYRRGRC